MPFNFFGWFSLLGSSILYLALGGACFIPLVFIALYFTIRDRNLGATVKNHWPLLAAVLYPFFPNLPGPVDEAVVAGVAICLEGYFSIQRRRLVTSETSMQKITVYNNKMPIFIILTLGLSLLLTSSTLAGLCDGLKDPECENKGISLFNAKNKDAILAFKELLERKPSDPICIHNLAISYYHFGFIDNAIGQLYVLTRGSIYNSYPKMDEALSLLGFCHIETNNYGLAKENFTRAIKINPNNPNHFYGRHLCNSKDGNVDGAKADLREAMKLGHPKAKEVFEKMEAEEKEVQVKKDNEEKLKAADEKTREKESRLAENKEANLQDDNAKKERLISDVDKEIARLPKVIEVMNKSSSDANEMEKLMGLVLTGNTLQSILAATFLSCAFQDGAKCASVNAQYQRRMQFANQYKGIIQERIQYANEETQRELIRFYQAVRTEYYRSPSRMINSDSSCKKKLQKQ